METRLKAPYPASFSINSNPVDIANNFCDYFTNIGPNLSSKISPTSSSPKDFLSRSLSESISLQPLTVDELSNIVRSFSANKDLGHDEVILLNLISSEFAVFVSICFTVHVKSLEYIHKNNSSVSSKYCSTPCIDS